MTPPVTLMIFHDKTGNSTPWGHRVTPGWYIGSSIDYSRHMQCLMPVNGIVYIIDTLQYIPKSVALPNRTTEDYLQQAIGDIIPIT